MDEFEIERKGRHYTCTRVIAGAGTLTQEVHVLGIGSKIDPAAYGPNGRLISSMEGAARLIAQEILREHEIIHGSMEE